MVKKVLIIFLAFMLIPSIALCATTKVLNQDTDLSPQGWTSGVLTFKSGSTVELNERGDVVSGVLQKNEYLRSTGVGYSEHGPVDSPLRLEYKGNDAITTFDQYGRVISGTLSSNYNHIYLIPHYEPMVLFKIGTSIVFDKNGNLLRGTIKDDTVLRPLGLTPIKFKAGTEVVFGPNANVVKGTIANDLTVKGITYPAGATLTFSQSDNPQKN